MKRWIIRMAFALTVVFTAVGYPVNECYAYTFDIRPGAADDDAPGTMRGLREGWVTPEIAEGIIAAGGFSPDVAAQVQAVIDEVRGEKNLEPQPIVQEEAKKEEPKACLHAYEPEIIQTADCSTVGIYVHRCKLCGDSYTEEIPVTEHDYQGHVTQEATCHNDGKMRYICSVCNDSYEEVYDKLEHRPGEWVRTKQVTCTESGEEVQHCEMCLESLNTRIIEPLGHTEGEWMTIKESTIISSGEREVRCKVCDAVITTEVLPINFTGLSFAVIGVFLILGFVTILLTKKKRKGKNEK